jgi:hypothetical protein
VNAQTQAHVIPNALSIGAVLCITTAVTLADGTLGVLTADVDMASSELFGGAPFAAVVNPDAVYPGAVGPVNTSGIFMGDAVRPDRFIYTDLPVYAIVDSAGNPLGYADPLFGTNDTGGDDFSSPLFELSLVGRLSLDYVWEDDRYYRLDAGSFVHDGSGSVAALSGGVEFLAPFGAPNFLWYGIGGVGLDLYDNAGVFGMIGNDDLWESGWPGATLDKNFFPVPNPGAMLTLGAGALLVARRRR